MRQKRTFARRTDELKNGRISSSVIEQYQAAQ
jgi:hypothetical protein